MKLQQKKHVTMNRNLHTYQCENITSTKIQKMTVHRDLEIGNN